MAFRSNLASGGWFVAAFFSLNTLILAAGCSSSKSNPSPETAISDAALLLICETGNAPACKQAADNVLERQPEALIQARPLYLRACEGGYMPGCSAYAVMLKDGLGGEPDKDEAANLIMRACKSGDADGCLGVYDMMRLGDGMEADPHRARDFLAQSIQLRKASCMRGNAADCSIAAEHLEGASAAALLEQGCKLGDLGCCERSKQTAPQDVNLRRDEPAKP